MEVGDKLKELNMTVDEMDRLTKAFKDEKFREMLRNYAQELSDPENKRRYEEEIKLLEQERGNTIEFIHPEPFRALRTSVNGKQKCFINICANAKVGKPESKWGLSEEGRRGQCWSLPHSLHPVRQDTDPKGNKIMIYDVIFHPDTLHIASKNKRFMDMVDSTAIQGVQDAFKVTLDKNNVREMSTKYKGTPQPCVVRKPIPGYKPKEASEKPDPLAFPYPDDRRPPTPSQTKPPESPKSFQSQPQRTKEPTKPNYTVKYRSFIDLQDFRCSRDSAQSPRPKEIVVTIDLPLLKAAAEASLEVKEGTLLLESKKPAYRLELPLAYPVDEDKGEAKFNKQRGQLTVTLPVLPSTEAFDFTVGPPPTSVSDGEAQEEMCEVEEEDTWRKEREGQESEDREVLEKQTWVEDGAEEEEGGRETGEKQLRGGLEGVVGEERVVGEKEKWRKQDWEGEQREEEQEIGVEKEVNWNKQIGKGEESEEETLKEQKQETGVAGFKCDTVDRCLDAPAEGETSRVASPETENQPVSITAEHSSGDGRVNLNACLESTPRMKTSYIKEETENTREKVETDAAFLHHTSSEESQTAAVSSTPANTQKDSCISPRTEESGNILATDKATESRREDPGGRVTLLSEELATGSVKPEMRESADEDDLPTEQILQNPQRNNKPPPALLREIDEDGNEEVISDHSTSAGLTFQNSLMYELD